MEPTAPVSTTAAPAPVVPPGNPTPKPAPPKVQWKKEIEASRRQREKLLPVWKDNVQFRKGKPFREQPAEDTVNVPVDWSRTKNKVAQLFFQVPEVKLKARQPQYMGATAVFAAALNFVLQREVKAYVAMDECLQDVVNASGFMAAMIGYNVTTESVTVPTVDTQLLTPDAVAAQFPQGIPTTTVERPVYQCYYGRRLSPSQVLRPVEFTGSDWQQARWLGYEDKITLAEAQRRGWITDAADYKDKHPERLETVSETSNDTDNTPVADYVRFSHIFYRASEFDPAEKDPRKIKQLVLLEGDDDPVVDDPLNWQKYNPQSREWIGLTSFPIKVATLTTISDEAVPPSDSEIGRPQVKELIQSRSQMVLQRKRSLPLRWFDVNRVDEVIAENLRKGVYQDMIPMEGPGDSAIGEVARASFPRESFEFNNVIGRDLDEAWSMGPNQQGFATPGDTSASEANIINQNANVRLDYERARVLRFFLEIAEGIGALMQLFQDDTAYAEVVGQNGVVALQPWDRQAIAGEFVYEARPDAAVRVDMGQKRVEGLNLYDKIRRDPLVNAQALLQRVVEDHGLDPSKVLVQPQPPQPKPAALRYSFTGEDLANPMVVAIAQKNSQAPVGPEDIAAAKKLMSDCGIPSLPPQELSLPEPGKDGQPPSASQIADLGGRPPEAEHPGPPGHAETISRRYEPGAEEAA